MPRTPPPNPKKKHKQKKKKNQFDSCGRVAAKRLDKVLFFGFRSRRMIQKFESEKNLEDHRCCSMVRWRAQRRARTQQKTQPATAHATSTTSATMRPIDSPVIWHTPLQRPLLSHTPASRAHDANGSKHWQGPPLQNSTQNSPLVVAAANQTTISANFIAVVGVDIRPRQPSAPGISVFLFVVIWSHS
jgi:hypothetical protein